MAIIIQLHVKGDTKPGSRQGRYYQNTITNSNRAKLPELCKDALKDAKLFKIRLGSLVLIQTGLFHSPSTARSLCRFK